MKLEKLFVFILIMFMFALPFSYANAADPKKLNIKIGLLIFLLMTL